MSHALYIVTKRGSHSKATCGSGSLLARAADEEVAVAHRAEVREVPEGEVELVEAHVARAVRVQLLEERACPITVIASPSATSDNTKSST